MRQHLFLISIVLVYQVLAEDQYSEVDYKDKNKEFLTEKKLLEHVILNLGRINKPESNGPEYYKEEYPAQKSRSNRKDTDDGKYILYDHPEDEKYEEEERISSENIYYNKYNKQQPKKIDVNVKIKNEKNDYYDNQGYDYVSKYESNYENQPKKVIVEVQKNDEDQITEPKKININVKIKKVQDFDEDVEKGAKKETVLDKLYKASKKYTWL